MRASDPVKMNTAAAPAEAASVFGRFDNATALQKSLMSMPSAVAQVGMTGIVAVSGAAGYFLVPSQVLVRVVTGSLGALGGNVARKKLAAQRQRAAGPAVASMLAGGLTKATPESITAVGKEYGVPAAEFNAQLDELYLAFLNACLESPTVATSELKELYQVQSVLGLSAMRAGKQIYAAGRRLFSINRAYLESVEPHDSKLLLEKFVFLAERVVSRDDSPQGYQYEQLRLQKLFSLSPERWLTMAEGAAEPFYLKSLESAVLDQKPATSEQIAQVRSALGISDLCAERMHGEILAEAASKALQDGKFEAAAAERLAAAQALLGMSEDAANAAVSGVSLPLYATTVDEVLNEIAVSEGQDAALAGKLALRAQELQVQAAAAWDLEKAALRSLAEANLNTAARSPAASFDAIAYLLDLCGRYSEFMVLTGRAASADAAFPEIFAGLRLKDGEREDEAKCALYRAQLTEFLKDSKVDEAEAATLAKVRTLLGLSEAEVVDVYAAVAGPMYRRGVKEAMEGSLGATEKEALRLSLADLALPAGVTVPIAVELYKERLREFAGDMNDEQCAELSALRAFLDLDISAVEAEHRELCAPLFRKELSQMWGWGGSDLYAERWENLEVLRVRLGLTENGARGLVASEACSALEDIKEKGLANLDKKMSDRSVQPDDFEASDALEMFNVIDFAADPKALCTDEARVLMNAMFFEGVEKFSLSLMRTLPNMMFAGVITEIGSPIVRRYASRQLTKGPWGETQEEWLLGLREALYFPMDVCEDIVQEEVQKHFQAQAAPVIAEVAPAEPAPEEPDTVEVVVDAADPAAPAEPVVS
jgi:hypothetical protein